MYTTKVPTSAVLQHSHWHIDLYCCNIIHQILFVTWTKKYKQIWLLIIQLLNIQLIKTIDSFNGSNTVGPKSFI